MIHIQVCARFQLKATKDDLKCLFLLYERICSGCLWMKNTMFMRFRAFVCVWHYSKLCGNKIIHSKQFSVVFFFCFFHSFSFIYEFYSYFCTLPSHSFRENDTRNSNLPWFLSINIHIIFCMNHLDHLNKSFYRVSHTEKCYPDRTGPDRFN